MAVGKRDSKKALQKVLGQGANINAGNPLQVFNPKVFAAVGLTTYSARNAPATNVNGTTWRDLLDMSVLANQEEIWSITLTVAGGWAGLCQMRIVDRNGNKLFPFTDYAEENTDFFSGVQWPFQGPVIVPILNGYRVQFRSSNAADGVGQTCALTELAVIIKG